MAVIFHRQNIVNLPAEKGNNIHVFYHAKLAGVKYLTNFEIRYVKNGVVETWINDRKITLGKGDLIVMLPGSVVTSTSLGEFDGISIFKSNDQEVWPHEITDKDHHEQHLMKSTLIDFYQSYKGKCIPELKNYFNFLMDKPEKLGSEAYTSKICKILQSNILKYYKGRNRVDRKRLATQLHILKRIEDVSAEIKNNCTTGFDLEDVASKSMMSKYELIRNFKEVHKVTPHQYYIQQKTIVAKNLLAQGMTVKRVAQLCGYPDIYSFSKQFKMMAGFAPSKLISQN